MPGVPHRHFSSGESSLVGPESSIREEGIFLTEDDSLTDDSVSDFGVESDADDSVRHAIITEPESFWEESSWMSMVQQSITSSIEERENLILELKEVLDAAVRERLEWQRKVKAMRRFRIPPEPGHWHQSVSSALTWRTREVEALRKEIRHLELRQRDERREFSQLRARQKRSTANSLRTWCSRSTLQSGFSCSMHSKSNISASSTTTRFKAPKKGLRSLGPDVHLILDHTLGDLGKGKGMPEVRPLGGLCARARQGNKQAWLLKNLKSKSTLNRFEE